MSFRRPAALAATCLVTIAALAGGAAAQFPHEEPTGQQDQAANETLVQHPGSGSDEDESGLVVDVDSPLDPEFGEDSRGDTSADRTNSTDDEGEAYGTPPVAPVIVLVALAAALQLARRRSV